MLLCPKYKCEHNVNIYKIIKNNLYVVMIMEQSKIERINFLAKKQKGDGLTPEEKEEQAILRREYIDSFKRNLVANLENTYIVDENGNKHKVKKHTDDDKS